MSLLNWNSPTERLNSRVSEWRVPLAETCFDEEEVQSVEKVLRSGWWTSGPETYELEREWEAYLNTSHAIAVSSGTAALHLAFQALELQKGDEVVIPSLNFVAAANTVLHFGAVPRFADVDSIATPLVSDQTIESVINEKTRGIVVMHYGGYPCPMEAIMELARKHGLWILEDAAHAPGAARGSIPCGKFGDVACFSFFGNKNISCAEGGLVVTDKDIIAQKILLLRSHGMTSLTWDRFRGHNFSYDVTMPGYNFRMDDIRSAILRIQLRSLDAYNDLRRQRDSWYRSMLNKNPRWILPFEGYDRTSSCHLFTVVLDENVSREAVMSFLKSRGIQSSIHYPPTHQFSYYRSMGKSHGDLAVTEALGRRILTLPLFPGMTYEQVQLVCESFYEAVDEGIRNDKTGKMA
jgi:dTDP-4-amino-4,6-dideoxygalactose transaminase